MLNGSDEGGDVVSGRGSSRNRIADGEAFLAGITWRRVCGMAVA